MLTAEKQVFVLIIILTWNQQLDMYVYLYLTVLFNLSTYFNNLIYVACMSCDVSQQTRFVSVLVPI